MIAKYFEEVEMAILYFQNIRYYALSKKIYNSKQGQKDISCENNRL